ncbi:hypothetical protein PEC730217_36180 [Pectobacterium carotovorum subsp. carotovorum]|nr:hypothetical protein PEC730217_36180 [Pectobacterium carotovorum subsp. carotovorum]
MLFGTSSILFIIKLRSVIGIVLSDKKIKWSFKL